MNIRTDTDNENFDGPEHDSCAIFLSVRKQGQSTFGTLKRSLGALVNMGHRTGFVNGEGDGAGVQTDIPRRLWARNLSRVGLPSYLATDPGFWVGHLLVPAEFPLVDFEQTVNKVFEQESLRLMYFQPGRIRESALGQNARINPPKFFQIAGHSDTLELEKRSFSVQIALEQNFPVHFASLSNSSVVYKMRGSVEALSHYYPDLQDHTYDTSVVLCHARYSTNTVSTFERAQPFSILGHNGEINTIDRLRIEARQIGVNLPISGSDSQDLDRLIHTLCVRYGFDLIEAMETVFPPVPDMLKRFPPELESAYNKCRSAFGPYAQGPAGVLARYQNSIVASVDALGLRPVWFMETEKEYAFSSERGAIPMDNMVCEPKALAPGEKMAILLHRGEQPVVMDHNQIRQHFFSRHTAANVKRNQSTMEGNKDKEINSNRTNYPVDGAGIGSTNLDELEWRSKFFTSVIDLSEVNPVLLEANGWLRDHLQENQALVSGKPDDLISSLGYDGPLAALSKLRVNLADYFKESVAVVTNPAIDHDREHEVFSISSLVGIAPNLSKPENQTDILIELACPLLLGSGNYLEEKIHREVAAKFGTRTVDQMIEYFQDKYKIIPIGVEDKEQVQEALQRISNSVIRSVQEGSVLILLSDHLVCSGNQGWFDPHLIISEIDSRLRSTNDSSGENLRRKVGVVISSASIRSVHDIALLTGFGADAIYPYAMLAVAAEHKDKTTISDFLPQQLTRFMANVTGGLEKIISTMGCHELRGYGRVCSSIGLAPSIARVFSCPNYFGNEEIGLNWKKLDEESSLRKKLISESNKELRLQQQARVYPKFWKVVQDYTSAIVGYSEIRKLYQQICEDSPVALRHLIRIRTRSDIVSPSEVDISVHGSNMPLVIDAMSFGSQGEASFRSYIQAAESMNIVCINGEGGELPAILGKYKKNRGQQIASGRFGVNAEFLNSADILEIKIGQGAKPGEGGMLPGYKVSAKVAAARKTPENVTLLSPSNNHDLYSIEDLAQLIEELHMVNPTARISVKIPVVPGIGVIAVGIVKAGADILNISGYDGGTGAARKHSQQYVGLPTEIGIIQAHRALQEAGLRERVELWANGGMKTGQDVVKMILLGANRVGFATMAMVALGCTICRQCNLGTCHVGIATQVETIEEALNQGIKTFKPRNVENDYLRIVRFFKGMADEIRQICAELGELKLQNLVGKSDLLEQIYLKDQIDLSPMFIPLPPKPKPALEPGVGILLIRPRNSLTSILTDLILKTIRSEGREVTYQDNVSAIDRALGSRLAGELMLQTELLSQIDMIHLRFGPSSLAGNGFAAWNTDKMDFLIEGGAQDGVAKGSQGGRVAVMKGMNHEGRRIDGSVGKSFAYGAQGGILLVQGDADARACVRLSGAKVLLGGEISAMLDESAIDIGIHSNLKGYACEYMTSGQVVILGDPGPFAFSGMTGGVVYQKLTPAFGFTLTSLKRRFAQSSHVTVSDIQMAQDILAIQYLLSEYIIALEQTYQFEQAERIQVMAREEQIREVFVKITPV